MSDRVSQDERRRVAAEVAAALGDEWSRDTSHDHDDYSIDHICHTNGQSFYLSWEYYPQSKGTRINVRPNWPIGADGREVYPYANEPRPGISVAATCTPIAIARDIEKRFLPEYGVAWNVQLARANGSIVDYARQTDSNAKRIEALNIGYHRRANQSDPTDITIYPTSSHAYQVRVQGGSVRFEHFSIPIDVALKILPLLQKGQGEQE